MKCLSLWQPGASLIVIGSKRFETRHWSTRYRGPLLIHAAKKWNMDLALTCTEQHFRTSLATGGMKEPKDVPRGCILGVADLVECWECHAAWLRSSKGANTSGMISEQEAAFGNFSPGRFAWQLENISRFPTPIPYIGHQGLFNVDDDLVSDQLAQGVLV